MTYATGKVLVQILSFWRSGNDTFQIARALHIPESLVANTLSRQREIHHEKNQRGAA